MRSVRGVAFFWPCVFFSVSLSGVVVLLPLLQQQQQQLRLLLLLLRLHFL
jgi:hypothetical protein